MDARVGKQIGQHLVQPRRITGDKHRLLGQVKLPLVIRSRHVRVTDSVDKISNKLDELTPDLDEIDAVVPQLRALLPPQIATLKSARTALLTSYSTMSGIIEQTEDIGGDAAGIGQDFDAAQNDDTFYLPLGVFENPDFQRVISLFLSPDGKAARFIVTHRGDPTAVESIERIPKIQTAAEESLKGTQTVEHLFSLRWKVVT